MNSFIQQNGTAFTLDGRTFRINAANNYYLGFAADVMAQAVFDLAIRMNVNVLRTWAFLDCGAAAPGETPTAAKGGAFFQYLNPATGKPDFNDGPTGLALLDRTIAMAEQNGLRLILPLINYWDDFGGTNQYLQWFGLKGREKFYLNADVKQAYRNYAEHLLMRVNTRTGRQYRDEPAIFAWELANEPRCPIPGGADILTAWVAEMSAFLKSLDRNHLVAVGDEGYFRRDGAADYPAYNGGFGVDCERLLGIPTIDFGTCHLYPDFAYKEDRAVFGQRWIREHIESGQRANKPMLIEEYGWKPESGPQLRDEVFGQWLSQVDASHGAGAGLWMIAAATESGQLYPDYDHYTVYKPEEVPSVVSFGRLANPLSA